MVSIRFTFLWRASRKSTIPPASSYLARAVTMNAMVGLMAMSTGGLTIRQRSIFPSSANLEQERPGLHYTMRG